MGNSSGPVSFTGVEGQSARRFAVAQVLAEQPEITGAEEGPQLIQLARLVQRIQHPESGIARVNGDFVANVETAIVEKVLDKANGLRMRGGEFMHVNGLLIKIARMEKLHAEGEVLRGPKRAVPAETDFPIFVVIQIILAQNARQIGAGRVEWLPGAIQRPLRNVVEIHLDGLSGQADRRGQQTCREKQPPEGLQHSG